MTPTEHEGTVAVEAAARIYWERNQALYPEGDRTPWEDLAPIQRHHVADAVLPIVWAALEALPDRVDSLREEWGWRIKDDSLGNGHMIGHVTSLFGTREDALSDAGNGREGLFEDQELVVRRVTEWEADE